MALTYRLKEARAVRSMLREGETLRPTARTLWEIQQLAGKLPVETATNLYLDILRQLQEALGRGEGRRAAALQELPRCQQQTRELFLNCIGGLPEPEGSPARLIGRESYGAFTLERVLLSPAPGALASANVYIPAGRDGRGPALLLVVGHTDRGKADPEYQYVAQAMAHAGLLTLVLDPLGEGERFEHYEQGLDFQPIQGCSGEHDLLDWKCKLLGESLARYFIRDGLCALDYLASRADVDPGRIALSGHSGGGAQTLMLMLAAGERFACAAPCAYVSDVRAMLECGVDPDNEMVWPGSLAAGLDDIDFLLGMAPKPLLLLSTQQDFFPREGTLRTLQRARSLWQALGGPAPELATASSQHAYTPSLAQAAARFFSRQLLGKEADFSSFSFSPLPDRQLWCTPEGILPKAFPGMRTLHDSLCGKLEALRRRREGLSLPQVREWLQGAAHCGRIAHAIAPRVYAEGVCGHYLYRCICWRPQEGYWNNGILLRDMRQPPPPNADAPLPTAIALWPQGTARLSEHAHWLHCACAGGWQVLVMDTAASGPLLPAPLGGSNMYIGWGTMYKLHTYLLQLGDSLFGLRLRQVLAALRMLKAWPEADGKRLLLYAEGEPSRLAGTAALLSGIPVCADSGYQPYEQIVRERYHDQTNTHEWIFPGALQWLDADKMQHWIQSEGLQAPDPAGAPPERAVQP